MSLSKKLLIYLSITSVIPLLLFGIGAINQSRNALKYEMGTFTNDLMVEKKKNVELMMANAEGLLTNLMGVESIKNILSEEENSDSSYNKLEAQAKIGYILSGYSNEQGLVSIDVFSTKGMHYHVGDTLDTNRLDYRLKDTLWNKAIHAKEDLVWNGIEDNINLNSKYSKVVTLTGLIKTIDDTTMMSNTIGMVVINLDVNAFYEAINRNELSEASYALIDGNSKIICAEDRNMIGTFINPVLMKRIENGSDFLSDGSKDTSVFTAFKHFNKGGWIIVGSIPKRILTDKTLSTSRNMYLLIFTSLCLTIFLEIFISKWYLDPIKHITMIFQELKDGKSGPKTRIKAKTKDEMGQLALWFNTFMEELEDKRKMEEALLYREHLLEGISHAANTLLGTANHTSAFGAALEILGEVTSTDRVYIYECLEGETQNEIIFSHRFEWDREGFNSHNHGSSHSLCKENWWYHRLSQGSLVGGIIREMSDIEKELTKNPDTLSILFVPIIIDNIFWGFISFEDCSEERAWSKVEEITLMAAASSFASAIKRVEAESALRKEMQNDFRRTVKNLQNIVFKLMIDKDHKAKITLFEGKIAAELGLDTDQVYGKTLEDTLRSGPTEVIKFHTRKAFQGEVRNFEAIIKDRYFYITLSPIVEQGNVIEVVGSGLDITELKEAEQKIREMAYYDFLTGLPNRILFKDRVHQEMLHARSSGSTMALLFLDLDHFKLINDTLGHAIGDQLLTKVADRLRTCIEEGDTVSRMGGDEFTLLLPYKKGEKQVMGTAQKIVDIFKKPFLIAGHELYVTTSIGISMYPLDGTDIETLVKNADMAMYRAKEQGRNNYQFFTSVMNQKILVRLDMENEIRKALEKNEFTLFYQPKICLETGKIAGAEALIRWIHPKRGMIPPGEFINIAEESGLIIPMGEWVLKTACAQSKRWIQKGFSDLSIAVNISPKQFVQPSFNEIVMNIIKESGVEPSHIELEITENCIMQDTVRNMVILNKLKEIGTKIAIDDFGTGFSSLSYIMKFSADILKVDKSFINKISEVGTSAAITRAIIHMAHSLNLKVIAEGVETVEQLQFLQAEKCHEMQGYLFCKPVPVQEFEKLLMEEKKLGY